MQIIQLLINGKTLLLSDKTRIGVTYQANNIGELQKRQGTYTNTFKIPLHSHNMEALEWSNVMTSGTDLPYRTNNATYIEEGIEIVSDGEAIIQKSDQDFIYLNFVGGNVDLSKAIGDTIFGDLYADDLTHTWNLANVFNSRLNNQYYIYPFVDWRTDIDTFYTTDTVDARQMLPMATAKGFFERLEAFTGYAFVGGYLTSDVHNNMMISPSDFTLNEDSFNDLTVSASYIYTGVVSEYIIEGVQITAFNTSQGGGYENHTFFPFYATEGAGFLSGSYYPATSRVANLKFAYDLQVVWGIIDAYLLLQTKEEHDFNLKIQIKEQGTVLAQAYHIIPPTKISPPYEDRFIGSVETGEINITAGLEYFVAFELQVGQHSNKTTTITFFETGGVFSVMPSLSLVFGNEIYFRDLFRMKAKDVLKDILNLRGLIIQTNSYTKEVQFNFLQDLKNNIPLAKDWSDKIDIRSHTLFFKFGKYAQRNNLLFKERDDVPDGLGDYYFDVDDQTLEAETDVVKLNHPATVEQNRYLGGNIPMIEAIDSLNEWNKPDWRILQLNSQNTASDTDFTDGAATNSTTENIPFARFVPFNDLVPDFYSVLTDILDRTKAPLLPVKLTAIEIQELDHVIPIYLDVPELDINGYFYINKISNYKQGFVPVEFVRL